MFRKRFYILLTAGLLAAGFSSYAQKLPEVKAVLAPDSVMIGDHVTLSVEVEKDLTQVVDFPAFENGKIGDELEILADFPVDTLERDGRRVKIRKQYLLTTFDAGQYNLGQFPTLFLDKNIIDTLYSADSLTLFVETFPIDTLTMQIYDIKEPMPAPVLTEEWLGYVILLLLLGQIAAAVIYIVVKAKRKKQGSVRKPRRPAEPPHVTAIRELEKLQGEKLWQNQRHKLYYTRLTDIVREYVEARYRVNAMEMTSEEITEALHELHIPERSFEQIRRLLSTADYVKFAKYIPNVEDNEMSYNDAYYFVEETKFLAPEPKEEEQGKEGQS